MSDNYSQELVDHAKQSVTDALKTTSKSVIKKKVEATGDLILINLLKELRKSQNLYHKLIQKQLLMNMINKYLKTDVNNRKKDRKLFMNKLFMYNNGISENSKSK